jgi:hypothetical protein
MKNLRVCSSLILALALAAVAGAADAALKIYYDPLTGNVAFDTAETRSGQLFVYNLELASNAPFTFRVDEHIRLTESTFAIVDSLQVGEGTLSSPVGGLLTIGDVLPIGLSEQVWATQFASSNNYRSPPSGLGRHLYVDVIGGGEPAPAEFIYGRPTGEFDNKLDLIDPNTVTWAGSAQLVYHAQSGHVDIVTNGIGGGHTTGIYLESAGQFQMAGLEPSLLPGGAFDTFNANVIFKVADLIEPGVLSLGEVLPAGLSLSEVEGLLSTAKFFERAGFRAPDLDFVDGGVSLSIAVIAAPEPATAGIAGVALLGLVAFRRCRCVL